MNNRPTQDAIEECERGRGDMDTRTVPVGCESYIVGAESGDEGNGGRGRGRVASSCWSVIHVRLL